MKIKEYYNNVASKYEELINSPQIDAHIMDEVKKIFIKYRITQGKILDVGCGPGNLKTALGENFSYTGIEIAENMIAKAREKGYEIIPGQMEDVLAQIPDKSFDYVICTSVLYFVKDIEPVLLEFERISKKGWMITLVEVTGHYAKNSPVDEPIYDHSNILIPGAVEDFSFYAWTSPRGEKMTERLVCKLAIRNHL